MKKLLLLMTVLLTNVIIMSAQTQIGIIGSAVDGSATDVKMFPVDSENYISPGYELKRGTLWFRENNVTNWGATAFPSGIAVKNSSDAIFIEVAGTYDISFNRITGAYSVIGEGTPIDPVDPIDPEFASIGVIGTSVGGWEADIDLSTTDGITYTLANQALVVGVAKFRQDNAWTINWGSADFPTGTAVQDGADIAVGVAGNYNITFNKETGAYSFELVGEPVDPIDPVDPVDPIDPEFASIGVIGTSVGGWEADIDLSTTDGITYTLANQALVVGVAKFRQDNAWTINWGSADFPTGTAVQDGADIAVGVAGNYNITFNKETGAYSFELVGEPVDPIDPVDPVDPEFASVGIIGTAVGGWEADVDMMTTDGVTYTLSNYTVVDGVAKFRQDNAWIINWGSADFPTGTGVQDGADIVVLAGTYDITFNIQTGLYLFSEPSLGVSEFNSTSFSVYPNPVTDGVLYFSVATDVTVYDLAGRLVAQASNTSSINVSSLANGVYIVKAGNGQTVRVVVK